MIHNNYLPLQSISLGPPGISTFLDKAAHCSSTMAFSFLGGLKKRRVNYSIGVDSYFKDFFYVKNFGCLNCISEPFQFWIRKSVLFLYKEGLFSKKKEALTTFSARFSYVLWSDVKEKNILVEHTIEPIVGPGEYGKPRVINWIHFCSLKKEYRHRDVVPFTPECYNKKIRDHDMETSLLDYLAAAFKRRHKADFFSGQELVLLIKWKEKVKVNADLKMSKEEKKVVQKGAELFQMNFQNLAELCGFMKKMRFI